MSESTSGKPDEGLDLFKLFFSELGSFLPYIYGQVTPTEVDKVFCATLETIIKHVTQTAPDWETAIRMYETLLLNQSPEFQAWHNQILNHYRFVKAQLLASQETPQPLIPPSCVDAEHLDAFVRLFSDLTISDEKEDVTEDEMDSEIFHSFTQELTSGSELPQPIWAPMHVEEFIDQGSSDDKEKTIYVMVDLFNLMAYIMYWILKKKTHYFRSRKEIIDCLGVLKQSYNQHVPENSHIHMVIKKFGPKEKWNAFMETFIQYFFIEGESSRTYHLYVVFPENKEDDDRLVAYMATYIKQHIHDGKPFILSHDKYRSLDNHNGGPIIYTYTNGKEVTRHIIHGYVDPNVLDCVEKVEPNLCIKDFDKPWKLELTYINRKEYKCKH